MTKKRTFSYKVACKKIFMVGPRGASHRAPLNTPLLTDDKGGGYTVQNSQRSWANIPS